MESPPGWILPWLRDCWWGQPCGLQYVCVSSSTWYWEYGLERWYAAIVSPWFSSWLQMLLYFTFSSQGGSEFRGLTISGRASSSARMFSFVIWSTMHRESSVPWSLRVTRPDEERERSQSSGVQECDDHWTGEQTMKLWIHVMSEDSQREEEKGNGDRAERGTVRVENRRVSSDRVWRSCEIISSTFRSPAPGMWRWTKILHHDPFWFYSPTDFLLSSVLSHWQAGKIPMW